ncbi:MAG: hypothetical protein AABP62_28865 [Planctomycetota bacterium]
MTASASKTHPYDITSTGLVVWPLGHYEAEVHYVLDETPTTTPRPRSLARTAGLIPLPLASLLFAEHSPTWDSIACKEVRKRERKRTERHFGRHFLGHGWEAMDRPQRLFQHPFRIWAGNECPPNCLQRVPQLRSN